MASPHLELPELRHKSVLVLETAQIELETVVFNASDDWYGQRAKCDGQLVQCRAARLLLPQRKTPALQPVDGQRAAADLAVAGLQLHIGRLGDRRGQGRKDARAQSLDLRVAAHQ